MAPQVTLLTYTPEPDRLVAAAARLCYSPAGIAEIKERLTSDQVTRLLKQLRENGHESPIEHVSFSFGIAGVSRALSHQLVRHRIASYSQQSQRYVKADDFAAICPPTIAQDPERVKIFEETLAVIRNAYRDLRAAGVPAEDARYLLPNACETKILVTMNARSLLNFLEIRICTRAQWEIRQLALEMRRLVRQAAPLLFQLSGPSCETRGYCREGKMSCGRAPALETVNNNLV